MSHKTTCRPAFGFGVCFFFFSFCTRETGHSFFFLFSHPIAAETKTTPLEYGGDLNMATSLFGATAAI
jgi:hypothetical protein